MNESFDLSAIGKRMKMVRERLHKTQANMSQDLGISLSHYSKLEVGIGGMSHGLIYQFCKTYNVDQPWFVYGKGEEPTYITENLDRDNNELDDETLLQIVEYVMNENIQKIAENFAASFHIKRANALAMMVRELLKARKERKQAEQRQAQKAELEAAAEHRAEEEARKAALQKDLENIHLDASSIPEEPPVKRGPGRPRKKA